MPTIRRMLRWASGAASSTGGADKLSRIAFLSQNSPLPQMLGIETMPSQPTLSRFLAALRQSTSEGLAGLHR